MSIERSQVPASPNELLDEWDLSGWVARLHDCVEPEYRARGLPASCRCAVDLLEPLILDNFSAFEPRPLIHCFAEPIFCEIEWHIYLPQPAALHLRHLLISIDQKVRLYHWRTYAKTMDVRMKRDVTVRTSTTSTWIDQVKAPKRHRVYDICW